MTNLKPSDFDGCLRTFATERMRDVAPGKVSVQWLGENGSVFKESDIDGALVEDLAEIARDEGYTLDQMLARLLIEKALKIMEREGLP